MPGNQKLASAGINKACVVQLCNKYTNHELLVGVIAPYVKSDVAKVGEPFVA